MERYASEVGALPCFATIETPSCGDVQSYLRTNCAETYKTAMEVCMKEGVSGADLDDCVFDVSMTGSPALAAAWWGKEQEATQADWALSQTQRTTV